MNFILALVLLFLAAHGVTTKPIGDGTIPASVPDTAQTTNPEQSPALNVSSRWKVEEAYCYVPGGRWKDRDFTKFMARNFCHSWPDMETVEELKNIKHCYVDDRDGREEFHKSIMFGIDHYYLGGDLALFYYDECVENMENLIVSCYHGGNTHIHEREAKFHYRANPGNGCDKDCWKHPCWWNHPCPEKPNAGQDGCGA